MNTVQLNTASLDKVIKRGGSGDVHNQSKVVEITENGSVEVVPDAGYTGLAKVTANVNVSGGGAEDLSDWEYYDCSSSAEDMSLYAAYLTGRMKKADVRDGVISKVQIGCILFAFASSDYDKYIAIAVDFSQPCIDANGTRTLREQITLYPNSELAQIVGMLQSLPRLTKEEFYKLD